MSERIRMQNGPFPAWSSQENDFKDIRYIGLIPKKRLHPRLIIRRFRFNSTLTKAPRSEERRVGKECRL